jgi:hypothetical protein
MKVGSFWLSLLTVLASLQLSATAPVYDVDIYWISINSYDGGWTTWPVDTGTSVSLKEKQSAFNPTGEFEVELVNVDGTEATATITTHLCCTDTFTATAIVSSGAYGPFTPVKGCNNPSSCDYQYDHQLQIRVSADDPDNDDDSGAAYHAGKAFMIVLSTLTYVVVV